MDMDQESVGSMEEMDSPRSVAAMAMAGKGRKWSYYKSNNIDVYVHSQILRIRAEDSHIGEDTVIAEVIEKITAGHVASSVVLLRSISRASPLGGHTTNPITT